MYVLCQPERARGAYDTIATALREEINVNLQEAKTRVWNKAGEQPVDIEELGADVWSLEGVKVLATPVGSKNFVAAHTAERMQKEHELLEAIPAVQDLQCAWQILLHCAGPRCNH